MRRSRLRSYADVAGRARAVAGAAAGAKVQSIAAGAARARGRRPRPPHRTAAGHVGRLRSSLSLSRMLFSARLCVLHGGGGVFCLYSFYARGALMPVNHVNRRERARFTCLRVASEPMVQLFLRPYFSFGSLHVCRELSNVFSHSRILGRGEAPLRARFYSLGWLFYSASIIKPWKYAFGACRR